MGIPFLTKLFEIFPMRSNEELLGDVAQTAAGDGAEFEYEPANFGTPGAPNQYSRKPQ